MSSDLPTYPEKLTIVPLADAPWTEVRVPGSKSITNRALVLAALHSKGYECFLGNMLDSEDTNVMQQALGCLGFELFGEGVLSGVRITSSLNSDIIPERSADLFVANSGTSMRFLTAMLSLGCGRYRLDGVTRMRERPIGHLLDALRQLNVVAFSEQNNNCPPVIVEANGLLGGSVHIKGDVSSHVFERLITGQCAIGRSRHCGESRSRGCWSRSLM